jgi:hypothetical protein
MSRSLETLVEELRHVVDNCSGALGCEPEGITAMPTDLAQEVLGELRRWLEHQRAGRRLVLVMRFCEAHAGSPGGGDDAA